MVAMEALEALDNKSLREKCNEYGLPNIPITDTSRKLLIRRLIKAMESGEKPAPAEVEKPKSRRETIHVIKVNVEKEVTKEKETPSKVKSSSSRKTIGPSSVPTNNESEHRSEAPVTQRRSGRITPASQSDLTVPSVVKRKIDVMVEDDEEDSIPIPVIVEKSSQEIPRQTRAPSLSKSVTVTTSYVRDTPPKEIVEEINDTESGEEEEEEEEEEYEEEKIKSEPVIEPTRYKYMSNSKTYDMSKPFAPSSDKMSYPYSSSRPTITSQAPSRVSLSQIPSLSYGSTATRRYTTGGYKDLRDGENKTFVHHHTDESKKIKTDPTESPYLSEFARRLSHLKAEPLSNTATLSKSNQNEEKPYLQAPPYYSPTRITSRRGISQNESVGESFNKFLIALDQKYHLKRNFIIFAIILALILIYVLFF